MSQINMADEEDNVAGKEKENQPTGDAPAQHGGTAPPIVDPASEVKEPPPPDVTQLCRDTFHKTAEYLHGELAATAEDYRLLEMMNKSTVVKYSEMKNIALNISQAMQDLNEKYRSLQPYLDQIDQIEESVASLEQAAYKLDAYSKRLEAKFKQLEKS